MQRLTQLPSKSALFIISAQLDGVVIYDRITIT